MVVLVPVAEPSATGAPSLPSVDGSSAAGDQHRRLSYQALLAESGLRVTPTGSRRRRSGVLRILGSAVVLSALVIGGVLFKHQVLDKRWADGVADQAAAVERQRGLEFERALDVETFAVDDYAAMMADEMFTEAAADASPNADGSVALAEVAAEWRALGLLEGSLDPQQLGRLAAEARPAFYDGGGGRIIVRDDLFEPARDFALTREMTLALTDQHHGWYDSLPSADPASRAGTIALFDGDALDTAVVITDTALADVVTQFDLIAADVPVGLSYAFDLLVGRTSLVVAERFAAPGLRSFTARDALLAEPVRGDAVVLIGGPASTQQAPTFDTSTGHSLGMTAWYYALASRLPAQVARAAVLGWSSDAVEHIDRNGTACVEARIWTRDDTTAAALFDGFSQWAATAPVAAQTVVERLATGFGVAVRSCDPGAGADTVTVASIDPIG